MYRAQNSLSISVYHDTVDKYSLRYGATKTYDIKTDKTFETT